MKPLYSKEYVRSATGFDTNNYRRRSSPSTIIKELWWENLAERRGKVKTIMTYKILTAHLDIAIEKPISTIVNHMKSKAAL